MVEPAAPTPDADLPETLEAALFRAHFELRGGARDAALRELCDAHPTHAAVLRRSMQRLHSTDSLLAQVGNAAVPEAARSAGSAGPAAGAFGPFELLHCLGRGGFAEVWLAEQREPIRRQVALKLLAPDRTDDQAILRFELERQALGLLQHENVARVLDAGRGPGGRSFFVMDYVDGLPLTTHCDRHRLSVRQRLELFTRVCAGVNHAHQKGVLHRDLKPSNILVQMQDGRAVPKIIDFGVAKALHGSWSDRSNLTEQGRLLGTPEYMSPEQAAGQAVDTRADVYSLGVLLYELLTGELPFASTELRRAGLLEAARILAERPPQRPSERLLGAGGRAAAIAAMRGTTIAELQSVLRSDLDWVVLQALSKDPDERYPSVTALVSDVQRFLDGEPLSARPPSLNYLMHKFVRRHRGGVIGAALILLLLVVTVIAALWGIVVVNDARTVAVEQRERAEDHAYAAEIATARLALLGGDAVAGRLQLSRTPAQLRGFEWRYLAARCREEQAVFAAFRTLDLVALPRSTRVVGCGFDGSVRIYDCSTGEEVRRLRGEGDERRSLALHRDGRRLAAAPNGTLEILDIETGATLLDVVLRDAAQAPVALREVTFLPDGERLACAGADGTLYVLSLSGEVLRTVATGQRWIRAIDFDRGGTTCLTAGEEGLVCLWDTRDWECRRRLQAHDRLAVFDAAFAADGTTFATCSGDGSARLWSTAGQATHPLWSHDTGAKLLRLRFAPDGTQLAIAGGYRDSYLELLDAATGRGAGPLLGHAEGVEAIAFEPGGKRLISGGFDRSLRVWSVVEDRWYRRFVHDVGDEDLAVSADGSALAIVSRAGRVSLYGTTDLEQRWTVPTGRRGVALTFDAERDRVLVLHPDGLTRWRAVDGGSDGAFVPEAGEEFTALATSVHGRDLILASERGHLLVLAPDTLQLRATVPLPGPGCAVAAVGDTVAATTGDGWLLCWRRGDLRELWRRRLDTGEGTYDVAIAPDGSRLAVSFFDGHLAILGASDGAERCRFDGHRDSADVAFSPDGSRVVSAGPDRRVKLYDPARALELLTLDDPPYPAARPVFSPDGNSLYCLSPVLSGTGFVYEWHAPADAVLR